MCIRDSYVISDIHGCYNEYITALKTINFSDNDILYILGDCIDRGYASIKVLQDMMFRPNVIPIDVYKRQRYHFMDSS